MFIIIRPVLSSQTASKLCKVIELPIELSFEKSIIILIDKYQKLLVENKKIKDLEMLIPNRVETDQIAKSGVPYNA